MAQLVSLTHETGDLSQYTASATDGGDLSVAAGAALAGSNYGLSFLFDDNNVIYAYKAFSSSTTNQVRIRVYIDPNGCTIDANTHFGLVYALTSGSTTLCSIQLGRNESGTGYRISCALMNDSAVSTMIGNDITDAPHYVEAKFTRASTNSSSDGRIDWWLDGTAQTSVTNVDNYDRWTNVTVISVGFINPQGNPNGTVYVDEVVANDDGGTIGAASYGSTGIPKHAMHYARMRR